MGEKMQKKCPGRPFKKGWKGGPGRPKGSVGVRKELREMFLEALDAAGGIDYLKGVAKKRPAPFLAAIAKMLPQSVKHEGDFVPRWSELPPTASKDAREAQAVIAVIVKGGNGDGNGH